MWYEKLEGPALQGYEKMKRELWTIAQNDLNIKNTSGLIERFLRPEDVGVASPEWTFSITTGAWRAIVDSEEIEDNRFIGICGVAYMQDTTQAASAIKITAGGQDLRFWNVQDINLSDDMRYFFDDPIIVKQNTNLTVEAYARATGTTEKIVLLGQVVEKAGILVQRGLI